MPHNPMSYDPKSLEAYFRFMAEATKSQAQASQMMEAMAKATSPGAWAEAMQRFVPEDASAQPPETFVELSEAYWQAFGFVPKAKYDELERQYLDLKDRLEAAEREARSAQRLLNQEGQEARAKEAVDAWSDVVQETLKVQSDWWSSWLGTSEKDDETST